LRFLPFGIGPVRQLLCLPLELHCCKGCLSSSPGIDNHVSKVAALAYPAATVLCVPGGLLLLRHLAPSGRGRLRRTVGSGTRFSRFEGSAELREAGSHKLKRERLRRRSADDDPKAVILAEQRGQWPADPVRLD
jgi:hypothetical protein